MMPRITRKDQRHLSETLLAENIVQASLALRFTHYCGEVAFDALVRASRGIAGARARLTDATLFSKGTGRGRKREYWIVVSRLDRELQASQKIFRSKCIRES